MTMAMTTTQILFTEVNRTNMYKNINRGTTAQKHTDNNNKENSGTKIKHT
jgi:hypothetical protein